MSDFYHAAIPEPFTILNLRLRPYSLGHIILLHRVGSAFVTGETPQEPDLITSVFICSQTYEEGVRAFDNPKLSKFMRRWERKVGRFDFPAKAKEFLEYIQAHSKAPLFKVAAGKTQPGACPLVQAVKIALLSETSLTESQVLNRCWSLCLWDFITILSRKGNLEIMDGAEIEQAAAMAEKMAKKYNPRSTCPSA